MDIDLDLDWGVIVGVAIVVAVLAILVIWAIVRGQLKKVITGTEGLVGKVAVAQTRLDPKGMVLVEGEHWTARADGGQVEQGEEVTVTEIDGLKLVVTKKKKTKGRK